MGLDEEMERLTREAREKGARERAEQEAALKSAQDEAKQAADAMRAAAREGEVEDDDAADDGEEGSLGMQVLAALGLVVVVVFVWKLIVAPLLAMAITLGMIAVAVWVILKLAGFGAKP